LNVPQSVASVDIVLELFLVTWILVALQRFDCSLCVHSATLHFTSGLFTLITSEAYINQIL